MSRSQKLNKFIENLKDIHKLTHEEFKNNYLYAGSNKRGWKYAKHRGITLKMVETYHRTYCLCETKIEENVYYQNKNNPKDIIVIGNVCTKRYELDRSRHCSRCDAIHKNNKDNYCNNCRIKIKIEKEQKEWQIEREKEQKEWEKKIRKELSHKLKNLEEINYYDLKEGSYYRYVKYGKYSKLKCVFFKLLTKKDDKLICQGYKSDFTWSINLFSSYYSFKFYKRNY